MTKRIDVHNHFLTPSYLRAMSEAGLTDTDGFPTPPFQPHSTLAMMDRHNITTAMLSISSPGLNFTQGPPATTLARQINENLATLIATNPTRFGGFALLPLPDIQAALTELANALGPLNLDGVSLLTNYNGRYLSAPEFEPLWQELNHRKTTVFIHPTQPPGFPTLSQNLPAPMLEYPFDTTRTIAGLIATGHLRRFPNIKIITCHGGGTIPYLTQRIAPLIAMFPQTAPPLTIPEIMAQLTSLYYDLTATASAATIAALTKIVPENHLLFGTDFPFMPEMSIPTQLKFLESEQYFSISQQKSLFETTALSLFPRLAA